jgi:HAD domain in Swiss Army Knife RNA repair proteins
MKVIFLDIDGVLNRIGTFNRTKTRWGGYVGMEPELVGRFNALVRKTGAEVVLSSTWRLHSEWRETMKANGLSFVFLDRTPNGQTRFRGAEIAAWLRNREDIDGYAILDDDSDFFAEQPLFRTSHEYGLTEEIARQIEQHLYANAGEAPTT